MVTAEFEADVSWLASLIWNLDLGTWKEFTNGLADFQVLKEFTPDTKIIRAVADLPFPLSGRELVSLIHRERDEDGTITFCGCSVNYDGCPVNGKYVRAITLLAFAELTPVGEGKTRITGIAHADPKCWVPAWLLNWLVRQRLDDVVRMKAVVAKWARDARDDNGINKTELPASSGDGSDDGKVNAAPSEPDTGTNEEVEGSSPLPEKGQPAKPRKNEKDDKAMKKKTHKKEPKERSEKSTSKKEKEKPETSSAEKKLKRKHHQSKAKQKETNGAETAT
eukprot:TRINITY_DN1914_c0_g1_i2.p1 TRINITY_DN1914_c0_g1~~TRINITY_DN1914_c0_g1_i2.p1  ORF type:complete len:279 (-),score=72.76 TRINITY_DN1914_c0_g1_i2:96-932(-)